MRDATQKKDHIHVNTARRHLYKVVQEQYMREPTQEKNLSDASFVQNPLPQQAGR